MFKHWRFDDEAKTYIGTRQVCDVLPAGLYKISEEYGEPRASVVVPREDEIICFANGAMKYVLAEIDRFWQSGEHYRKLGVTHKRSFLLHGPHGCGKSGIVNYLIQDVTTQRAGIAIQVHNVGRFWEALPLLRQVENGRACMVIFEDLEQHLDYDEEAVLEILDGTSTLGDNLLFVSTTNNIHKLPARLVARPSRIDTLIEVALPDDDLRREYLTFLADKTTLKSAANMKQWVKDTAGFSLAQLKELVIGVVIYSQDYGACVTRLAALSKHDANDDD